MIVMTNQGLYCPAGNFHIDPKRGVDHAVVTHAHSDHARRGSRQYYCETSGASLLKTRLGNNISVESFPYRKPFKINGVTVSFHSAGHILGSAQVRIEHAGQVWVISGDYKREPDPTCVPFEVVPCDVFITEATFGTPAYIWPKDQNTGKDIFDWWMKNSETGMNSVLFAYSLGKAQRVLGTLQPYAQKPIYCHPATTVLTDCYRKEGVQLAPTKCLSRISADRVLRGELFLVPQSFLKDAQSEILGDRYETAFASGWMKSNHFGYDRGFLMSDHADWNDLIQTAKETKAHTVYVQHRGQGALVKHLRTLGFKAFPESELWPRPSDQLSLF